MFVSNTATGGKGGDAPNGSGNGCGGGSQHGCACGSGGYASGGGGAFANQCPGGAGGFGGGGGGAAGQPEPAGPGGFGAGGGGVFDYGAGGGGAGIGGSVFVDSGVITIVECSFVGNQVVGGAGGWGGNKYVDPYLNELRAGASGTGIGLDFFTRDARVRPLLTATTSGGGQVSADPSRPPYLSNSLATVSAITDPGWTLLQWFGDATGNSSPLPVRVTRNKYVEAVFGTTLSTPPIVSASPQSDLYPYGTTVKLTAIPPPGTYFQNWTGDATGASNPISLVITTANPSVSCQFGALGSGEYSLTVVENGRGHVQVSPSANRYTSQFVTLTALPDPGQDFVGWSGDANGTQSALLLQMNQSKTISVTFTTRPTLRVGTPVEGLSEDGFRLTIQGEFGTPYSVSSSTNLRDWNLVGTITNVFGTVQLTDPTATNQSATFYRASTP